MEKINNSPDELKNELGKFKEERKEIVEEKGEYEPGTIHTLITNLTFVENKIREIKEALAEFKLNGGTNVIEQNQ